MMRKVMGILKKWLRKSFVSRPEKMPVETSAKTETKTGKGSLLERLEAYLLAHYDFRFNVLTEQTEYRRKGEDVFRQMEQRTLNTFCIDARNRGINCWDKDVSRLLLSEKVAA